MVHFGTSGWRGIIGREVTFRKVRMVTAAILETLAEIAPQPQLIIVGYDTRMLSERLAQSAAQLIASKGVRVELTPRDIPSPVLSSAVIKRGATGGIIFTGSHNPPEYNGLKLYTKEGILASKAVTDRVEEHYRALHDDYDDVFLPNPALFGSHDPKPAYLADLQELIDWKAIRRSRIRLVVDPLFGSAREYLDHILLENQVPVRVIHNTRDPFFGGYAPECSSANLYRLREVMRRSGAMLGLATDGDGDRFGILDRGARLKDSGLTLGLILDYLVRRRGFCGGVGRTLATSHLIDAVARHHDLELIETPVGFKNFGPLIVDGTLSFAGEESAGLAWVRHLPERDGILACLLVAEMVAVEGKGLVELKQELFKRVGTFAFRRTQMGLTARAQQTLARRAEQEWSEVDGRTVVKVDRGDGLRLVFEGGGWLLIRRAGTEPKIRLYAEGRSSEELRHLMHLARRLMSSDFP